MAVQVAGRSTPGNVASGSWNATALNTGRLRFSFTFAQSSASGAYSGDRAFYANGDGGIYLSSGVFAIYNNAGGGTAIYGQTITWAAGATVNFDIVQTGSPSVTISGALTGNVTNQGFSRGATPIFTSGQALGVMQFTSGGFSFSGLGTISDLDDGVTTLLGDAAITLDADTASGTAAVELVGDAAITLENDTAFGEEAPGPLLGDASITLADDTLSSTGSIELIGNAAIVLADDVAIGAGPPGMSVGAAIVKQRLNAAQPPSGTFTTDAIETTTGSVLVAILMRGRWDATSNPKGPTDSQGNTWTRIGAEQAYAGYPSSKAAMYWCVNAAGSAAHTFTMTFTDDGAGGGDEVTIAVVELFGVAMVDSSSHVERAIGTATIQGTAVTPTGPSITLAPICGNGPVGQTHAFTLTAGAVTAGWVGVPGATAAGNPSNNGYIQIDTKVLVNENGSYAGQPVNVAAAGTSNEGGQLFQAVFQLAAGMLATGAIALGDDTAAGEGVLPLEGAGAVQLEDDAALGAGAIDVTGAAAIALGADTAAGTGAVEAVGAAAMLLDDDVAAGVAVIDVWGSAAIVLADDVASGGSASELVGDAAIQLADDVAIGTGAVLVPLIGNAAIQLEDDRCIQPVASQVRIHAVFIDGIHARWVHDEIAAVFADEEGALMSDEKILNQNETPKTIRARAFTSEDYVDLTTWTSLTFKMTGPATIEGAAIGDAAGYASYTFTGTELVVPGTYAAQFRGIDASGQPRTIPEATKLRVVVVPAS